MIRITDLTFFTNSEYADTEALLRAQQASLLYVQPLRGMAETEVVKHISPQTRIISREGIRFFVSKNGWCYIPRQTLRHLRQSRPDIVIVHGFGFMMQVIRLQIALGKKTKIILWHHAEHPPQHPLKKWLYRIADRNISRYLFTSKGNATEWVDAGLIADLNKVAEIPPTLSALVQKDKLPSKKETGMDNGLNYLWVGRLDAIKDPLTLILAFKRFVREQPDARLHMIYQSQTLLPAIRAELAEDEILSRAIILHGAIDHPQLATWYSAADFFISASTREAGSVTILEAMSCGCVPVVSAIPPSLQVTGNGSVALSFPPGDVDGLLHALRQSTQVNREEWSQKGKEFFTKEYSAGAVAARLFAICSSLVNE